ncbi:MAG: helix-turn-helix transcriptional regulator [Paucibacter sp.]|nr:helix-turn-helix transcriptional regulator [Roseateles sp.]
MPSPLAANSNPANTATDSRTRRSRDRLLGALFELMCERGYERLTVQNLLDRAGIGRATFYAHFDSKDELLACSVANLRAWLLDERAARPGQRLGFTEAFFGHVAAHRQLYQMTVVRESELSVEHKIRAMLMELVRADLAPGRSRHGQPDAALELSTQYVVGALWSTLAWWMATPTAWTAAEIHALFLRMTLPGLELGLQASL